LALVSCCLAAGALAVRAATAALLIVAALRSDRVGMFGAGRLPKSGELRERERLCDAAAVLTRGAFRGDERLVIARLRERRLGRHECETAGEIRARREEIVRAHAKPTRVATVSPLDVLDVVVLRLERIEL